MAYFIQVFETKVSGERMINVIVIIECRQSGRISPYKWKCQDNKSDLSFSCFVLLACEC